MSDIFISYNQEDRRWVEGFAKALASRGWSVWWDRSIPTGESFDRVIEQALTNTKCVVVVWSTRSVNSDWVKAEAEAAKKRKILLPVRIEEVTLPLGFSRLQTQSLVGWEVGQPHAGYQQLQQDIARLVTSALSPEFLVRKRWWQRQHPLWLLSLPTVVVALVIVGLMRWTMATTVHLELTIERIEFVVDANPTAIQPIVNVANIRALSVEKFSTVSFEPASIEVADPEKGSNRTDVVPDSAWTPLTPSGSKIGFVAEGAKLHPRLTLEPLSDEEPAGLKLATTAAAGTQIILEARGRATKDDERKRLYDGLTIKHRGQGNRTLEVHSSLIITADYADVTGVSVFSTHEQQERTYRTRLRESMPWMDIQARTDGPIFSTTLSSEQATPIMSKSIPVRELEFTALDQYGDRISALTGNGTITFPGYPHLGRIELTKGEAIGVTGLSGFMITELTLHPHEGGLRLVGQGMADEVRTRQGQIPIPHHVSAFDALWHNRILTVVLAFLLWVLPTTVGAYRLNQASRRR